MSNERHSADRRGSRPVGKTRPQPHAGGVRTGAPVLTRIEQIRSALGDILQWSGPADGALSRWLRAHPRLGMRDRAEVAEAVYDVLRNLRRYRQLAESGRGNATRRLAVLGLARVLGPAQVRPMLEPDEAAWLERVWRIDGETLPRAVRHSMPDWLDEVIGQMPEPEALMAALNQPAALDIRVNPLKADRDTILAELVSFWEADGSQGQPPQATPWSPWGIRIHGRTALNRWSRFTDGSVEVQDEGSQLLALLVGPKRGEMIIDFCAGAGGKTLLIGALMRSTGRLYAFDVSQSRLARLGPRLARSGLSNVEPVTIANENDTRVKRLSGKAHRVLVDAPCSGTGTLRRNPDIKWRQNPEALDELSSLQARILASAARCVAPGGRLVYATCSLLEQENEAQARAFLVSHPEFREVPVGQILEGRSALPVTGPYLKLRPDQHGTDGFFAAVFERGTN
nr:RsmB/NOP family class I SAM-dependent RNA methyltransferase [Pseudomonas sp.]